MFFDVDQGKQFIKKKKIKTEKSISTSTSILKEGFQGRRSASSNLEGMSNESIKSNLDNDAQLIAEIDAIEDDFNQKLADYDSTYNMLMNKTQAYISSSDNTDVTKNRNVFVNRVNDSEAMQATTVGCYNTGTSDYIGTFVDNPNRTMPPPDRVWQWSSYSDCKNEAIAGNFAFFGLQNFQGGTQSECYLSNDLQEAESLGVANNSSIGTDGKIYGGAWSNAVYAVNPTPAIVGGLQIQSDLGTAVDEETCKVRAADLGYSTFALSGDSSQTIYGNNGGVSCNKYCHGSRGTPWQGPSELPTEWKGAQCVSAGNSQTKSCDFVGQDPDTPGILPCTCTRNDNFPYSTEVPPGVYTSPYVAPPPITTGMCYVGNNVNNSKATGRAYSLVTAFEFDTKANADICTLLMNGQLGIWNTVDAGNPEWQESVAGNADFLQNHLQIDHNTPSGNADCHPTSGGAINTGNILASYGLNCKPPFGGISYQLKNINTEECINFGDGATPTTFTCAPQFPDEYWKFNPVGNSFMLESAYNGACLYSNADGRFSTYGCVPEYNDQLWNITYPDPTDEMTIQLQDVNSGKCLYAHPGGVLGVFECNAAWNDQWWTINQQGGDIPIPSSGNWSANTTNAIINQYGTSPTSANYVIGTEGDPAPNCEKYYQSWYQCGNGAAKPINIDWESTTTEVTFDCTAEVNACENFAFYVNDSGMITINNTISGAFLWSVNVYSADAVPNPAYSALNSKFGVNYMNAGETLGINEFIGSPAGLYHVILINDPVTTLTGLKVRYFTNNCGNNVGNDNTASVVYQINPANSALLGKVGFINNQNALQEYPAEMIQPGTDYDNFGSYDSVGHDITKFTSNGGTADDCKAQCNATTNCGGFAFHNNTCFLKDSGMFPSGLRQPFDGAELYVRSKMVEGDVSCPKTIDEGITANDWAAIPSAGVNMDMNTLCKLGAVTDDDLKQLEIKKQILELSAETLENKIAALISNDNDLTNKLTDRINNLKKDLRKYYIIRNKLGDDDVVEGMTNYSYMQEQMVADQEQFVSTNYKYLIISFLALFLVGAIIKISRK